MQAVKEVLEKERQEWEEGKREKRELSDRSDAGSDYCQLKFDRTCEQVALLYDLKTFVYAI